MRISISAVLLAIALAGCNSTPPPAPAKEEARQPTVFDDDLKTMDRAKAAGAKIEDRVNDLNQQLNQQEGNAPQQDADAPKN